MKNKNSESLKEKKKNTKPYTIKVPFSNTENTSLVYKEQSAFFRPSKARKAMNRLKCKKDLLIYYEIMKKPKGLSEEYHE